MPIPGRGKVLETKTTADPLYRRSVRLARPWLERNVEPAGHWGELKNKQIFDKESRHETRRPLARAFSSKIWK